MRKTYEVTLTSHDKQLLSRACSLAIMYREEQMVRETNVTTLNRFIEHRDELRAMKKRLSSLKGEKV